MKQLFVPKKFKPQSLRLIQIANKILDRYQTLGLDLTVRQLYYQFIANYYDELPDEWVDKATGSKNNEGTYKKIVALINDARLAGLIDWNRLVDRGRGVSRISTWASPEQIVDILPRAYRRNKWQDQPNFVIAMIEKDALSEVLAGPCNEYEVPYIANKGYSSASAMYLIGRELRRACQQGQDVHVLYLGDHDPSGMDMTNDVRKRLEMFAENDVEVHRLALNYDQVEQYNPPPNPTKATDSRTSGYEAEFGDTCWELDALGPEIIQDLVRDTILELRDENAWEESLRKEKREISMLQDLANRVKTGRIKLQPTKDFNEDEEEADDE